MQQWNAKVLFPADSDYSNRVISVKYAPSNAGNPQITLEMEVVSPVSKEIAGVEYNIAGCKTKNYYSINGYDKDTGEIDKDKTKNNRQRITDLYTLFGLTPPTDFDVPLDVSGFKGKVVLTQMNSNITEMRKTPTAEQASKNQQGDIQKHPVTGKALIQYWPQVQEIFGLAPEGQSAVKGETTY